MTGLAWLLTDTQFLREVRDVLQTLCLLYLVIKSR